MFGERPKKPIILNAWFQLETWKRICDDLGSNILVLCCSVITRNGRITASKYVDILGNQVNPMFQMLLHDNDANFQEDSSLIHITRSVVLVSGA